MLKRARSTTKRDKLLTGNSSRIFICYSHRDSTFVYPFARALEAAGSWPFVDNFSIAYGLNWRRCVNQAIADCETFFLFWSPSAAISDEVRREYQHALELGKKIVPILLSKFPDLPSDVAEFQGVSFVEAFGDWGPERVRREIANYVGASHQLASGQLRNAIMADIVFEISDLIEEIGRHAESEKLQDGKTVLKSIEPEVLVALFKAGIRMGRRSR